MLRRIAVHILVVNPRSSLQHENVPIIVSIQHIFSITCLLAYPFTVYLYNQSFFVLYYLRSMDKWIVCSGLFCCGCTKNHNHCITFLCTNVMTEFLCLRTWCKHMFCPIELFCHQSYIHSIIREHYSLLGYGQHMVSDLSIILRFNCGVILVVSFRPYNYKWKLKYSNLCGVCVCVERQGGGGGEREWEKGEREEKESADLYYHMHCIMNCYTPECTYSGKF